MTIVAPATGNSFAEGEEVRLEGSAEDPEDGSLVGSRLVWTLTAGGDLGTGGSLVVSTLPRGTHTIQLAATDSSGSSSTAVVSIRIAAPAHAPDRRTGETNPYAGRLERTPVKQDDEVVLLGRAGAANELVYGVVDEPLSQYNRTTNPVSPPLPRISLRRSGVSAIAAAAGRILPTSPHQAAVVTVTTSLPAQFQLEIVGLLNPGQDTAATLAFAPPVAGAAIGLGVGDLDAFDEVSGAKALAAPVGRNVQYHDEVTLTYPEMAGGQLRARVRVFSFEDVGFPELRDGPAPGPTTEVSALTSVALFPGSRLVVAHGDAFYGSRTGPHLLIAYLNAARHVVADVYEYRRTRASDSNGDPRTDTRALVHVQHAVLTATPVTDAAAAAGGWDVVVGRGEQLGIRDPLSTRDVVVVARQENGRFLQDALSLEALSAGTPPPARLGFGSFPFGRFPDASGNQVELTILGNSPLRALLGRVVREPGPGSCEAVGLLVLADTNRGAVVQSMSVFINDPASGTGVAFGPLEPSPPWPSVLELRARTPTTQLTRTAIAAGGLVSDRNGLIDHRGTGLTGFGDVFARQCQGVDSRPLLGPMPSFYVAEPDAARLSAVTLPTADSSQIIVGPLDAAIDEKPVMLAADANGDAAYYDSTRCIEQPVRKCRRLFLGDADFHYFIENFETQNVILQQPPKHVDFLRALGGIVDVSMRDNYLAEFVQTTTNDGSVTRRLKTDWSLGVRVGIGSGSSSSGSTPKDKEGFTDERSRSSDEQLAIDIEHKSVASEFNATTATVSLTQTTGAVDDDVVWSKIQTTDFWRFPVQGGRLEGAPGSATVLPNSAYMEIAVPGEPVTSIGAGSASDAYQPTHQVGNILTYPMISGASQDIGELFDFLGAYIPSNEDGSRQCKPLQDDNPGCIAVVNGALTQVAQVLAGQEFVAGEFERLTNPVDVAEELQVGGISYSAELQFNTNVRRGATVLNTDTIKVNLKGKMSIKPGAKFEPEKSGRGAADRMKSIDAELRAQASFENERISENNLGSQTRIALRVPANIPIQRSYRIRPSFGFTPGGTLQVSYEVSTEGPAATFWQQNYGTPDAALNLPFRIVRQGLVFVLNTDFSRNRMKGFFVRDGAGIDGRRPWEKVGPLLAAAPNAGDPVQLEVQVFNLSVGTALSNLGVEFTAQAYENGNPTGPVLPIGTTTIDFLPFRGQFADEPNGHVASAFVIWDTTAFGPSSATSLKDYVVYVTLDPANAINNETHELTDRYNDPLKGPTGEVVDATHEKGQNNLGWGLVRIAPSLSLASPTQISAHLKPGGAAEPGAMVRLSLQTSDDRGVPQSFEKTGWVPQLVGQARQPLQLRIGLQAEDLSRDHGVLQVFDGNPDLGARMIASRAVQGLTGDHVTVEEIEWRPQSAGDRVLYVRYFGSGGVVTRPLQLPVHVDP